MLLLRIQEEEPAPPRRLDDTVPRDLETICMKAMAKSAGASLPGRRLVRGRAAPLFARRAGPRSPAGALSAFWRKCRRKPVVSGLAASLVLAVVLGFAGVTWQWRRAEHQRGHALLALASGFSTLSVGARTRPSRPQPPGLSAPPRGLPRLLAQLAPGPESHLPRTEYHAQLR